MARLELHEIRSVNPGINPRDLMDWFGSGTVSIPQWARLTIGPLLRKAGFDETRPIHVRPKGNQIAFRAVTEAFLAKHLGGRAEPLDRARDFRGSSLKVEEGAHLVPGLAG